MPDFTANIRIVSGDLATQPDIDTLVCGIYPDLAAEGSLNRSIMAAAGHQLDEFILENIYKPRIGDAFAVPPFNLPVKHLIYVVIPRWRDGFFDEDIQLKRAYRAAMQMAQRMNLATIAFPALGTGKNKFPVGRAARVALQGIIDRDTNHFKEVRVVCNRDDTYAAFNEQLAKRRV